jgi:protein CWC15
VSFSDPLSNIHRARSVLSIWICSLKIIRQLGQNAPEELKERDLKAELQKRELEHFRRQGKIDQSKLLTATDMPPPPPPPPSSSSPSSSSSPLASSATATTSSADAPQPQDDAKKMQALHAALAQFDDSDDSNSSSDSDSDSDSDSEDDEAELRRALQMIKRTQQEDQKRKEQEIEATAAAQRNEEVLRGNPLLADNDVSFQIKRRWDDDVVFRNQAAAEPKRKKRFINDTTRSDFHRNFLRKYVE